MTNQLYQLQIVHKRMKTSLKVLLTAAVATLGLNTIHAQNLLINGSFEWLPDQARPWTPEGWNTPIDGNYHDAYSTLEPTPLGFRSTTLVAAEGYNHVRRNLYPTASSGDLVVMDSIIYNLAPEIIPGQTMLELRGAFNPSGSTNLTMYGRIIFYDASNSLIAQFDTDMVGVSGGWVYASTGALIVPENAASFKVQGRATYSSLGINGYARMDDFQVIVIPEPSHIAAALGVLIFAGVMIRRHRRK